MIDDNDRRNNQAAELPLIVFNLQVFTGEIWCRSAMHPTFLILTKALSSDESVAPSTLASPCREEITELAWPPILW